MIDLTVHPETLEKNIAFCREKKIALPTFAMMKNPDLIPASVKAQLEEIGLWDLHSANLFQRLLKRARVEVPSKFQKALVDANAAQVDAMSKTFAACGKPV